MWLTGNDSGLLALGHSQLPIVFKLPPIQYLHLISVVPGNQP